MPVAKDLSDFRLHMERMGLWFYVLEPSRKLIRLFQYNRMWHFAILVVVWIYAGYMLSWKLFLGRVYSGIVMGCSYMALQWIAISRSARSLEEFVLLMKDILEKNATPEDNEILQTLMKPAWKFARLFTVYGIIIVLCAFLIPITYDTIVAIIGVGKPFDMVIAVEGLLPGQKNALHWFLVWGHMIGDFYGTLFLIGNVSLAMLSVKYTIVAIRILCKNIDNWTETLEVSEPLNMNDIISQHVSVIKLAGLLNDFMALQSVLQNVSATLTTALFMYSTKTQEGSQMIFCLNNSIGLLCVVFMFCDLGEKLHTESMILQERFYSVPWYSMRIELKRDLIMILRQAHRPLQINYRGWTVGMISFTQVMNTTYSYLMLLTSVE